MTKGLRVSSKNRKSIKFRKFSDHDCDLFIDGRNMGPIKAYYYYDFHIVDGKIDHWGRKLPIPKLCDGCK